MDMRWAGDTRKKMSIAMVNMAIVAVFGGQNLSSYFQGREMATASFVLSIGCFLLVPVLCIEMYCYRNKTIGTWHARFGDGTPASQAMLGILYACFWAFAIHALILLTTRECNICTGNPASGMRLFHYAYWLHVLPSLVIAVGAPLQFTPLVRKACGFALHRWLGRLVLLASALHQASATVIFASELFFSKVDCSAVSAAEAGQCGWRYRIYVAGFVPKNMVCWASIVLGLRSARRKNIAEHGAWMYRLGAMWVITIVVAHIIIYPVGYIVGPEWKYAVGEWTEWLFVLPVEMYIRRSGRFNVQAPTSKNTHDPSEPHEDNNMECPFLAQGA